MTGLPSTEPRHIRFARLRQTNDGPSDGRTIFDTMLVRHLRYAGIGVTEVDYVARRGSSMPLWVPNVEPIGLNEIKSRTASPAWTIVSHEALFGSLCCEPIDLAVVHNYFPRFYFPGRPVMNAYYRTGSKRYYNSVFKAARVLVFLSKQDLNAAVNDHPFVASKSVYLPPPPYHADIVERRIDLIHFSGTGDWWPKRRSKTKSTEIEEAILRGYELSDFGNPISPAFGFIDERFSVGFKLKLMQMVYAHDVIASVVDLSNEIKAFAPGYPFFRFVRSFSEALDYFNGIRELMGRQGLDRAFANAEPRSNLPTWSNAAEKIITLLESHQ